ncbi:MAG: alpha/beta fold hydrolase [Burkholderiaceae bacterium]|jgi:pimeloyl-ACP methyl ester carboxylesterase|nr:alpha/beta fold hydrolase [Burkholderiaceae bacterium]
MSLATLLRLSLALQLIAGTLLARWLLPDGSSWLAAIAVGVLLPAVGTALVLAIELTVGAIVDPRAPRRSPLHVLRVWLGETACSLRVFGWRQPFEAGFAEPTVVRDAARPAVLLIAGYVCNRAVWRPLLQSGRLSHCNVATVNIEPVFGDIDLYADEVHAAVERLRAASGAPQVTLVGHSMGGLAIRAYLRRHGDAAVARVITLASPHHGTVFGVLGHGANARQMAKGCLYLTTLAGAETVARRQRFVCIATADDNLVVPRTSPLLPDAEHHVIDGVGHLALIEDPRAWALIAQSIR